MIRTSKMKILLIISISIISIFFIGKKIFQSAKRNLFKDQSAWSGKDIKIKYAGSREIEESKGRNNYLKIIADESKIFLDGQSKKE